MFSRKGTSITVTEAPVRQVFGKHQDSSLVSPVYDFTGKPSPEVAFNTMYWDNPYYQTITIEATDDGGATWTTVWRPDHSHGNYIVAATRFEVPLIGFAGKPAVQLRFHYMASNYGKYWGIDNVFIGERDYTPTPGGLVVGTVTDANTGNGTVDATVADQNDPSVQAKTVATPDDPNVGDGFFSLFVPNPGKHVLAASKFHYTTGSRTEKVPADKTVSASYRLKAGRLKVTPGSLDASVGWGKHATKELTIENTGSAPAAPLIGEQATGTQAGMAKGAPLQRIKGDYQRRGPERPGPQVSATRHQRTGRGLVQHRRAHHDPEGALVPRLDPQVRHRRVRYRGGRPGHGMAVPAAQVGDLAAYCLDALLAGQRRAGLPYELLDHLTGRSGPLIGVMAQPDGVSRVATGDAVDQLGGLTGEGGESEPLVDRTLHGLDVLEHVAQAERGRPEHQAGPGVYGLRQHVPEVHEAARDQQGTAPDHPGQQRIEGLGRGQCGTVGPVPEAL